MSTIVAGVDFGTLSVRVSLFDSERGRLGFGTAEYPLRRKNEDPDYATQSHADHMEALVLATRKALRSSGVDGQQVASIALDTTGSSVIPLGKGLVPLDDYYLWCDHRAWREAARITSVASSMAVKAIDWCGGVYSSEWGFAKLLHWLRHNPEKRKQFVTALEHCDMVAATLSGVTEGASVSRSVCAMGHKWMWNASLGGFPPEQFFSEVDPLLACITERLQGRYATSDHIAGELCPQWADKLGVRPGIPIPVGAFDAHWDAIVAGSVHPRYTGVEAGLSAAGDIFDAIARRSSVPVSELSKNLETYRAGQTGLLRLTWDNGDRTVLVNPELGGATLGWKLTHTAQDELFAAIEGTAFHTRVILERMEQFGVKIRRVINGGGVPQKNPKLNQVYADILGKTVLVPQSDVTSLGSAIFAFLAAGTFPSIEQAQDALCPKYKVFEPDPSSVAVYGELYPLYRKLYFAFGQGSAAPVKIGDVLPEIRRIAVEVRATQ